MELETEQTERGLRIFLNTDKKAAVLIKEGEEERILLPINETCSNNTYYYENTSGLAKTRQGYVGYYNGEPDTIEILN